jgi:hypothetical protein
MKYKLVVFFIIGMVLSLLFSFILLIAMQTEPIWIVFLCIGTLSGFTSVIISSFIDVDNNDYDYGYDDGKKETTNEEKKPFIVKLKTTCPHCGAPMENDTCAYCGCKSEIYKVIR